MNVMMITSLNTYTANMQMKTKWQQKKASGDFTADGAMTMEERLRKDAQEAMDGLMGGGSKVSLGQIQTKLMYGKKLSAEEMDYLRENNPELYKKARSIEMEREAYEKELKQCKTKEDVQKVKMAHTTAALARTKDIESNPNIPEGQKLGLIMEQLCKTNAMSDVERKFVQSGEYNRLPTEEEQRQAEKALKEAREDQQDIRDKADDTSLETAKDGAAETPEDGMPAQDVTEHTVSEVHKETGEFDNRASAGTGSSRQMPVFTGTSPKAGKASKNTYGPDVRVRSNKTVAKPRTTRLQAEATPEVRKVKRARAQASYAKPPSTGDAAGSIVNVKG